MNIELSRATDVNEIEALYGAVVDDLLANVNYPGWKKGIYQIVGSIVINHVQEENYQLAAWKIDAQDHEVYVIHTLAVHPQFKGLKIAQKLLEYADELAKNNGVKTIRLDVRKGNVPAIKLYERCGYTYVGAINLDFRGSDLGLFELYEKII